MGRIRSISAEKVLNDFSYDLRFEKHPGDPRVEMRAVYAPNGRGKTTFLRAASALLTPGPESWATLLESNLKNIRVDLVDGWIAMEREGAGIGGFVLSAARNEEDPVQVTVSPADYTGSYKNMIWRERADNLRISSVISSLSPGCVFAGDDRLVDKSSFDADRAGRKRSAPSAVKSLLSEAERYLTQGAFVAVSGNKAQGAVYNEITKVTLRGGESSLAVDARAKILEGLDRVLARGEPMQKYGLLSLGQVQSVRKQVQDARVNNRNFPNLLLILRPYLESLDEQIDSLSDSFAAIDAFVQAVNYFLERKYLQFTTQEGITLRNPTGEELDPDNLSSGERHLLLMLSLAVTVRSTGALLIIDEPELSLGISWQRDLLENIARCAEGAPCQVVIASHSVQVLTALADESITSPVEAPIA